MAHDPVNHPLRPMYRVLAALTGLYVLVFGIVGVVRASGQALFGREETVALGLRTNLAFALLSVVAGVVVIIAYVLGRNIDQFVNYWGGLLFLVVGTGMLAVLHTEANVLNFSVATVIVSYVIGMVLYTAGRYGKAGSEEQARAADLSKLLP